MRKHWKRRLVTNNSNCVQFYTINLAGGFHCKDLLRDSHGAVVVTLETRSGVKKDVVGVYHLQNNERLRLSEIPVKPGESLRILAQGFKRPCPFPFQYIAVTDSFCRFPKMLFFSGFKNYGL